MLPPSFHRDFLWLDCSKNIENTPIDGFRQVVKLTVDTEPDFLKKMVLKRRELGCFLRKKTV